MWKLVLEINAVERSMNGARGAEREWCAWSGASTETRE